MTCTQYFMKHKYMYIYVTKYLGHLSNHDLSKIGHCSSGSTSVVDDGRQEF